MDGDQGGGAEHDLGVDLAKLGISVGGKNVEKGKATASPVGVTPVQVGEGTPPVEGIQGPIKSIPVPAGKRHPSEVVDGVLKRQEKKWHRDADKRIGW
ncbi:MAG: hypothetical protein ABH867_02810 [Patescibacteria group bacterium]|nr:hypothetical protein [Patescibacteria group bacterium]